MLLKGKQAEEREYVKYILPLCPLYAEHSGEEDAD
jgi:hypothetical protein